ncbi:hypothetical protein ACQY0O_004951 [Thecaphora frezii]
MPAPSSPLLSAHPRPPYFFSEFQKQLVRLYIARLKESAEAGDRIPIPETAEEEQAGGALWEASEREVKGFRLRTVTEHIEVDVPKRKKWLRRSDYKGVQKRRALDGEAEGNGKMGEDVDGNLQDGAKGKQRDAEGDGAAAPMDEESQQHREEQQGEQEQDGDETDRDDQNLDGIDEEQQQQQQLDEISTEDEEMRSLPDAAESEDEASMSTPASASGSTTATTTTTAATASVSSSPVVWDWEPIAQASIIRRRGNRPCRFECLDQMNVKYASVEAP